VAAPKWSRRAVPPMAVLAALALVASIAVGLDGDDGVKVEAVGSDELPAAIAAEPDVTTSSITGATSTTIANPTTTTRAKPTTTTRESTTTTTTGDSTTTTTAPEEVREPEIAASPATDLPERAWIRVTGSGLPPGRVLVMQCSASRRDGEPPTGCDYGSWVNQGESDAWVDERGHLSWTRPVRRVSGTDCSEAPGRCVVAVIQVVGPERRALATAPLAFSGPMGPERPMTVSAHPTADLVDGQVISVVGENLLGPNEHFSLYQYGQPGPNAAKVFGEPVWGKVGRDGKLQVAMPVQSVLTSHMGTVDCRTTSCYIDVSYGGIPDIPISFVTAAGSDD
jgi:hypothetical protein